MYQRFYEPGGDVVTITNGALKPAMDIFSVGLVVHSLHFTSNVSYKITHGAI
jgi:hypothetical protein